MSLVNPLVFQWETPLLRSGSGYIYIYDEDGRIKLLSRKVMEDYLGRPLTKHETVGYRNGDKSDCRLENLVLHVRAGTPFDWIVCKECGSIGSIEIRSQELLREDDS